MIIPNIWENAKNGNQTTNQVPAAQMIFLRLDAALQQTAAQQQQQQQNLEMFNLTT